MTDFPRGEIRLLMAAAVFGIAVAAPTCMNFDIWWHLRTGRWILEHGRVPHSDIYSFVAGGAWWVNPSWLADIWLYGLWRVGGMAALIALSGALFGAAVGLAACAGSDAARRARVFAALLCAYAAAPSALVRPLAFSFPLTAFFLWVLRTRRDAWLWALPLCVALWVNLHAGFAAGCILVFLAFCAETVGQLRAPTPDWRRAGKLFLTGLACGAACFVNPFGYGVLTYPFRLTGSRLFMSKILEWMPPGWNLAFAPYWGLLALVVFALAATARRAALFDVLVLAAFAWLSFRARRQIGVFGVAAAPILAKHLTLLAGRRFAGPRARRMTAAALGLAALAMTAHRSLSVEDDSPPKKAVDFLQSLPFQGRLFHEYQWGGYLIWRLFPQRRVFIDGRCLVYGDKGFREWERIYLCEPGWEDALRGWRVEAMLLNRRRPALADGRPNPLPFASPHWRTVYWDDDAVVLLRDTPANARLIAANDWTLTNPALVVSSLSRRRRLAAIQKQLERKIALDPECAVAHENLGLCHLFRGRAKEAEREFRAALRVRPRRSSAAFNLAAALAMQGRVDDALHWFQRAAELNPEEPTYFLALADAWRRKRDPRRERAALRRALDLAGGAQAERIRRRLQRIETDGS